MVRIIDSTLREGEQAANVLFSREAKEKIIAGLVGLGVDEIELGISHPLNRELISLAGYARHTWPRQPFSVWCRCRAEDIAFAATLGPSCLSLSIPASDLHLQKKLKKNRKWALEQLTCSIRQALDMGISRVALGLEDATRADVVSGDLKVYHSWRFENVPFEG